MAPASTIPAATDRFFGRRADVDAVHDALSTSRLVTLTGSGGVGKTRLAMEAVRCNPDHDAQAIGFVDLSVIDDPRSVQAAFAQATVAGATAGAGIDHVVSALAESDAILVVDNCEHVQHEAAGAILALLEGCPNLQILATSREVLHIPGELVWAVGPLDPDDAVRLFTSRADAARRGATDGLDAEIEEICARLEGIPLAVELAAGWMASVSVKTIRSRLLDRLELLRSRNPRAPARHHSLQAAIEWSVELLDDQQRLGFTRLAVFPGSFTQAAAHSVAAVDLDELDGLVSKSLISAVADADGGVRYRMLDTVRLYAQEKLATLGEEPQLRAKHLAFFLEQSARVHRDDELGGAEPEVAELAAELHNLRSALSWASDQDPSAALRLVANTREAWMQRSQGEGLEWAISLLSRGGYRDEVRLVGSLAAGRLAVANQNHDAARTCLSDAIALASELGDRRVLAAARHYRGISGMLTRDLDQALEDLGSSTELFEQIGQRQGVGRGLGVLGFVHLYRGDPDRARIVLRSALDVVCANEDAWGEGQVRLGLGLAAKSRGDVTEAVAQLSQSAAKLASIGDVSILGVVLSTLAGLQLADDPERSLRLAGATAGFRRRAGGRYPPATIEEIENVRRRGIELIGAHAAEREWRDGEQLAPDEAVSLLTTGVSERWEHPLTTRQREVAKLVADGLTNAQIAARLHLSERTVENHVYNALTTLGLNNRTQLASWTARREASAHP